MFLTRGQDVNCELNTRCKPPRWGQEGQLSPGPRALRGLIIEYFFDVYFRNWSEMHFI